jgi:glycine cleavage system regulatory protein
MSSSLVLTVIGPDRPGIVERLAEAIASHGGNWVESRMVHLAGQFTGVLRIEVPEEQSESLSEALRRLVGEDLRVLIAASREAGPATGAPPIALELVGQDRPGIVRDVSRALASQGVNVEELETSCDSAPMSGERLFRARVQLRLPAGGSLDALREALEKLAGELMVDLAWDE